MPAPPGAPFLDVDADSLTLGPVTSWTNGGSEGGALAPVNSAPTCLAGGAGGHQQVRCLAASTQDLRIAFGAQPAQTVWAMVARRGPTVGYIFDGAAVGFRNAFITRALVPPSTPAGNRWSIYAGVVEQRSISSEFDGDWHRFAGDFSAADPRLFIDEALQDLVPGGSAGVGVLSGVTLSASVNAGAHGDTDIVRLVMWSDGTTFVEARTWLADAYPVL